jgi:ATP synthase protein I
MFLSQRSRSMPDEDIKRRRAGAFSPDAGDKALADRLGALEKRLDAVNGRKAGEQRSEPTPQSQSAVGQALRLSGEFIAGVIVGSGFGWGFDRWLGTSPWGMILFLLLGFGAGVYNVMRSAGLLKPGRS